MHSHPLIFGLVVGFVCGLAVPYILVLCAYMFGGE